MVVVVEVVVVVVVVDVEVVVVVDVVVVVVEVLIERGMVMTLRRCLGMRYISWPTPFGL